MTYLNRGCDPLEEECESCLGALCKVCYEEFKKKSGNNEITNSASEIEQDSSEPDCENCDREKKPDCSRCEIILNVCLNCSENKTCEFKIR
jgi:hypothetical protein